MFLDFLQKHNPGLIDYGVHLLEHGHIEPDTYIIDLDAIEENARLLRDMAVKKNMTLYFISKQLGRNPEISRRVLAAGCAAQPHSSGFTGMVAVDFREAQILHSAGLPVRHIGHLCQIPSKFTNAALDIKPDVITIFSMEKMQELSEAATGRGLVQDVLLRIHDDGDIFYEGQEGGFHLTDLSNTLEQLKYLSGIRLAGITTFPCFLYDDKAGRSLPTPNAHTLVRAAVLMGKHGLHNLQINMPSCNSVAVIPMAAQLGATHLEPGHSLTGTNPDNLADAALKPAILYMSEVSHVYENRSFCYGGGCYRRGNLRHALVKTPKGLLECNAAAPDPRAIDYHIQLQGVFPAGAPVCMSFRTQIFVTRSRVALVEGLSKSSPVLHSIWDSGGNTCPGTKI
jgi:predicted amino acid racemase